MQDSKEYLRGAVKIGKQLDLKLEQTKKCAAMFRESKKRAMPIEIQDELWKLTLAMAITEWGEGTVLDDFSDERFVMVINKKRRMGI